MVIQIVGVFFIAAINVTLHDNMGFDGLVCRLLNSYH